MSDCPAATTQLLPGAILLVFKATEVDRFFFDIKVSPESDRV
jgi:hypothetical protein